VDEVGAGDPAELAFGRRRVAELLAVGLDVEELALVEVEAEDRVEQRVRGGPVSTSSVVL
jgi:hypothetical protein